MKNIFLLICLLQFSPQVFSFEKVDINLSSENFTKKEMGEDRREQLESVAKQLNIARKDAATLLSKANEIKDDAEKKRIQTDLDKVNGQIDELLVSIEKISVGKLEQDLFSGVQSKGFDWQRELEEIFKPIVFELKSMTERPRKIEKLRSQKTFYEDLLPTSIHAVEKLSEINKLKTSPELKIELKKISDNWHKRRTDIENKLKITNFELEQLLAPKSEESKDIIQSIRVFLAGRGLSLLLAIGLFSLCLYLVRALHSLYERRLSLREKRKGFTSRLIGFLFSTLGVVLSFALAMSVLSFRGDWLLLGLLLIFLVSSGLALRSSMPLFFQEIKVLLNIGAVREDERILYNGLPWKIANIGVYSTLVNPMLTGGQIRLTLRELITLKSRPTTNKESWFPTRENDFVLLDDEIYGKVLTQTPEYVEVRVVGAVQTFPVQSFLAKNPRNLSIEGFVIMIHLGLDYSHQPNITTYILDNLDCFMRKKLQQQKFATYMTGLFIDFNEIASSSLNIAIIATFNGDAAEHYYAIRRLLNKLSVDACNHFGWSVPFHQVSLHMETPIKFNAERSSLKPQKVFATEPVAE